MTKRVICSRGTGALCGRRGSELTAVLVMMNELVASGIEGDANSLWRGTSDEASRVAVEQASVVGEVKSKKPLPPRKRTLSLEESDCQIEGPTTSKMCCSPVESQAVPRAYARCRSPTEVEWTHPDENILVEDLIFQDTYKDSSLQYPREDAVWRIYSVKLRSAERFKLLEKSPISFQVAEEKQPILSIVSQLFPTHSPRLQELTAMELIYRSPAWSALWRSVAHADSLKKTVFHLHRNKEGRVECFCIRMLDQNDDEARKAQVVFYDAICNKTYRVTRDSHEDIDYNQVTCTLREVLSVTALNSKFADGFIVRKN